MSTQQEGPGRQTSARPPKWKQDMLSDAEVWRARAALARAIGKDIHDPECRQDMENIAQGYDRLAEHAEMGRFTWPPEEDQSRQSGR